MMHVGTLHKKVLPQIILLLVVHSHACANGFGWGAPQEILPYEIGVVVFECFVILFALKQNIFKSLYLSLTANFLSWVAGTAVFFLFGIASLALLGWNPQEEGKYIVIALVGQCFFLFVNIIIELGTIKELGKLEINKRLLRTVGFMNLITWAVGTWLFSEMIKVG